MRLFKKLRRSVEKPSKHLIPVSVQELQLLHLLSSAEATKWSREVMRTQNEWIFIGMTVVNKTGSEFGFEQDMIVYTVSRFPQILHHTLRITVHDL